MIQKPFKVRSKALRQSASGQACAVRIAGICNNDSSTTVLAHVNFGGHGMATKESDLSACYACSSCHDAIDGRMPWKRDDSVIFSAVMKTQHKMIESGLIEVKP
ncbi:MAG: DUF1364 family protein [Gammaproteobacteria bacterium]|nr:DUF1364 family protein [Gammaproteobacteria bacterium]